MVMDQWRESCMLFLLLLLIVLFLFWLVYIAVIVWFLMALVSRAPCKSALCAPERRKGAVHIQPSLHLITLVYYPLQRHAPHDSPQHSRVGKDRQTDRHAAGGGPTVSCLAQWKGEGHNVRTVESETQSSFSGHQNNSRGRDLDRFTCTPSVQ